MINLAQSCEWKHSFNTCFWRGKLASVASKSAEQMHYGVQNSSMRFSVYRSFWYHNSQVIRISWEYRKIYYIFRSNMMSSKPMFTLPFWAYRLHMSTIKSLHFYNTAFCVFQRYWCYDSERIAGKRRIWRKACHGVGLFRPEMQHEIRVLYSITRTHGLMESLTHSMKTESCHDANFGVTGGTGGGQPPGATSNDKVGIMITFGFKCWRLNKMEGILQTIICNEISWTKMFLCCFKLHWT